MILEELTPEAAWTPDCQGKQDYDGRIISVSTRYYPGAGGGGTMMLSVGPEGIATSTVPYGARPEARAAIHLNYGHGDYLVWREAKFSDPTEAGVKSQVEAWVREQLAAVVAAMGGFAAFRAP